MTRIILIRHGETDHTLAGKYCGASNPPLNARGLRQAGKLRSGLVGIDIEKVYSSDLKRAVQTAAEVFGGRPVEETRDLGEMNFGIFEGLKHDEIMQKQADLYGRWIHSPLTVRIPGGESLEDVSNRVNRKLASFINKHPGKTIAAVSHGGPIRIILCGILNRSLNALRYIRQDAGAFNIIDFPPGCPPEIIRMNVTSHLEDC